MFADEAACGRYLEQLRWPDGFVCPGCGVVDEPWRLRSRAVLKCRHCRRQQRVLAGTVLDATKTPLVTWVTAAWLMVAAKPGVSAKTLERTLGVSYHTAWAMLQRYRVAMVRSERERLSGDVEVDETLVGGVSRGGKRGRGSPSKTVVVVAVEVRHPRGWGRCRLRVTPSADQADLTPIVCDLVEPGSVLLTDAWPGYDLLEQLGYVRTATNLRRQSRPAHQVHPGVHRIASLLKRWLLGTHQGSVDPDHLQAYLEEFTFRFNRRNSGHRGLVLRRLLEQAVTTGPVRFDDLTFGYWPKNPTALLPAAPGAIRTLIVADTHNGRARLTSRIDADARFTRIGRASAPDEARGQAEGLAADLVVIDGDRDDGATLDVVKQTRAAGSAITIAVHVGKRTGCSRDEMLAVGADIAVHKAGRQNLLNACAEHARPDTDVPF